MHNLTFRVKLPSIAILKRNKRGKALLLKILRKENYANSLTFSCGYYIIYYYSKISRAKSCARAKGRL